MGVAAHRAMAHTDRCTGRGCLWVKHFGAPHHSTRPGGAVLPVEGVHADGGVGAHLRGPILRDESGGVAAHRATAHTDRCTGRGCLWVKRIGVPHDSTRPGGAVLPVEGVHADGGVGAGLASEDRPSGESVAGVAVDRATVHTDRCTGRGCLWVKHIGAPHHSTGPGGVVLPVEGADTHLAVGGARLRGPTLR